MQHGRGNPPPVRSQRVGPRFPRRRVWQLALTAVAALGSTLAFALPRHGSAARLPLGSLAALGPLASHGDPGSLGPEGVPVPAAPTLAPAASPAPGQSVDGISCAPLEQLAFHIHAHLTVFVNGVARKIPSGVGVSAPQSIGDPSQGLLRRVGGPASRVRLYTHAADGIVHDGVADPDGATPSETSSTSGASR